MSRPKNLPRSKSVLLEPILREDINIGRTDELTKLVDEPVHYSWTAFGIFIFLIAVAFVVAGSALA